jgi:hypothetical protein
MGWLLLASAGKFDPLTRRQTDNEPRLTWFLLMFLSAMRTMRFDDGIRWIFEIAFLDMNSR